MTVAKTKTSKNSRPVDAHSETETREYKGDGVSATSKYSVDQNAKTEPSVSTPKDKKEQSDRPVDTNDRA